MTKSRTALATLFSLAAAWPAAAFTDPPIVTAEEALAAYDAEFHDAIAGGRRRCRRDAGEDEIVVCGRTDDARMRVPYEPPPGEVHRIAGDIPSGTDAMANADRCLRLCNVGIQVNLIAAVRALERGLDRILHPD